MLKTTGLQGWTLGADSLPYLEFALSAFLFVANEVSAQLPSSLLLAAMLPCHKGLLPVRIYKLN